MADDGPAMASRFLESITPPCLCAEDPLEILPKADAMRRDILRRLAIDPGRGALSAQVQKVHRRPGYRVEVVRLEVFEKLYLPLSVYIPDGATVGRAPLVILPAGCSSGTGSFYLQSLAGNLATMGMVAIASEGFCGNGARIALDTRPALGYARGLLGLPSETTLHLQELVSAITWAMEHYPLINPDKIGAAGYSYGGGLAYLLAQVDTRIGAVSVPATTLSEWGVCDCPAPRNPLATPGAGIGGARLAPDFVTSPPVELPRLPLLMRIALLYPRAIHTTSGYADPTAHPREIGPIMDYARMLYAAGGYEDRVCYQTDDGDHNYGRNRREDTYRWFAHILLGRPLAACVEVKVRFVPERDLLVDIAGGRGPADELKAEIKRQRRRPDASRGLFRSGVWRLGGGGRDRVRRVVEKLFAGSSIPIARRSIVWDITSEDLRVTAERCETGPVSFPAFTFSHAASSPGRRLLYLPRRGTRQEIPVIRDLLRDHASVVSIDFLGIGELESDRMSIHQLGAPLMHNDPSLPQENTLLLASYLLGDAGPAWDIYANGWAASLQAAFLKHLAPSRVGALTLVDVPRDEFERLGSGERIPDLLLWGGLLRQTSVAEMVFPLGWGEVRFLDTGPGLMQRINDSVTLRYWKRVLGRIWP